MYLWNITKLKQQLSDGGIEQKDSMKYLITLSVVGMIPIPKIPFVTGISIHHFFGAVVLILGTLYCYNKNRGSEGRDFLSRYLSLTLIVLVRFCPIVIIAGLIMSTGVLLRLTDNEQKIIIFSFLYLIQFFIYLRVGYHIADVSTGEIYETK